MGSMSTGEMFTEDQVAAMTPTERERLDLVRVTSREEKILSLMTPDERKRWLKANKVKKPTRRDLNKRERQNKRVARARR